MAVTDPDIRSNSTVGTITLPCTQIAVHVLIKGIMIDRMRRTSSVTLKIFRHSNDYVGYSLYQALGHAFRLIDATNRETREVSWRMPHAMWTTHARLKSFICPRLFMAFITTATSATTLEAAVEFGLVSSSSYLDRSKHALSRSLMRRRRSISFAKM